MPSVVQPFLRLPIIDRDRDQYNSESDHSPKKRLYPDVLVSNALVMGCHSSRRKQLD